MTGTKIVLVSVASFVAALIVFGLLFVWALPRIDSPVVSGLTGVLIGSFAGLASSIVGALVTFWTSGQDAETKLKDRISTHAIQLTQMDYELRQKSLATSGACQEFLAPAKVYRTFYYALLELHTSGKWPKEVENLGLLNIFVLGSGNKS